MNTITKTVEKLVTHSSSVRIYSNMCVLCGIQYHTINSDAQQSSGNRAERRSNTVCLSNMMSIFPTSTTGG